MDENKELNTEFQEEFAEELENVEEIEDWETDEYESEEIYEEEILEESKGTNIAFRVILILLAVGIVALSFVTSLNTNKYNNMGYIDIYGETIQDMADMNGCSLEEFLEIYGLPADMPGDTNTNAAENMLPTGVVAEEMATQLNSIKSVIGMNSNISNFELFKLMNGMPADVTEKTPIGEAKGRVKLKFVVEDEEGLEEFKEIYGLGDEITLESEYREVRPYIEAQTKAQYEEQLAIQEEIMKQLEQQAATGEATDDAEAEPEE